MFPFDIRTKDGKVTPYKVQLVPRPIQLWELVYPEEADKQVMEIIGGEHAASKKFKKILGIVRKFMGLTKIKEKEIFKTSPPWRQHVGLHFLGNKKDQRDELFNEQL
jgi:hypothetical protein